MTKRTMEIMVGALVILGAACFLYFAYHSANIHPTYNGYRLMADFDRADGIQVGSDVRIAGIKIGQVIGASLNEKTYQASIEMSINPLTTIPHDSAAQIVSDGLLGGKYLAIVPGADDKMLGEGEHFRFTQSSVNIESLIGQMIFSKDAAATPPPPPAPALSAEAPAPSSEAPAPAEASPTPLNAGH